MSPPQERSCTVLAPATVANVAVGFDILGFAVDGVGDRVTVTRTTATGGVELESIGGVATDLPREPERNTATVALLALVEDLHPGHGFRVSLEKGIPLGSGMGGSAASAVGAVVAANELLDQPVPREELLRYAAAGEEAASGFAHADNIAPCLLGGLTAVVANNPTEVVRIPVPDDLLCVLVRPRIEIETRSARGVLAADVSLADHVRQTMKLTGFLVGCFRGDHELIARSLQDVIVEPQRAQLIPGFTAARSAALEAGAGGFGIAGSGPSVFAWVGSEAAAGRIEAAVRDAFGAAGLETDAWVSPIRRHGAGPVDR